MTRPETLREALGFDDIGLLPTDKTSIKSRKELDVSTYLSRHNRIKYPIIASPMDMISDVEMCVAMNSIGAAAILHRFMPIETQVKKAAYIKEQTGKSYAAIGLQDYQERVSGLVYHANVDLLFMDTANGSLEMVKDFMEWYNIFYLAKNGFCVRPDVVIGNTLTKASVSRAINLGADGIRHGIGIGSVCLTSDMTGIQCPPVTALYYGWKSMRNFELEQADLDADVFSRPSLLLDGGIRKPGDLVKAIVCGADAVICGGIFAGCVETPGEVRDGKKVFRGMASKQVLDDYGLHDGKEENLFVEGKQIEVPYTGKSAKTVVYEFVNGLKSAMSYLGFETLQEARGSLWEDKCIGVRL